MQDHDDDDDDGSCAHVHVHDGSCCLVGLASDHLLDDLEVPLILTTFLSLGAACVVCVCVCVCCLFGDQKEENKTGWGLEGLKI